MNDAGETPAAETVRVRTRAAELPPVIRHLTQEGGNIQIGYACDFGDFCYEFEYGLAPDKLDRHILTTVTGACNLPVVEPGAQHYLRIRKRLRYGYALRPRTRPRHGSPSPRSPHNPANTLPRSHESPSWPA